MIEVHNIRKSYAAFEAVRGVSFDAARGQVLGLLGPNGAGKSTTIRIITGYLPPSSGSVTVDGLDSIRQSRAVRMRLGYMPESTPLYPEMRVVEYLLHRARLYGVARTGRRATVERAIERCRLGEVRRTRIGHLSKGYKQRVGLASAILHDPPALILDEPTSGLDPAQIIETRTLIRELATDKTVILCSHILPEVELTCDRVVIMARGQVRAQGTVQELIQPLRDAARYVVEVRPLHPRGPAADIKAIAESFEAMEGVAAVRVESTEVERAAGHSGHGKGANGEAHWVRLAVSPWPDAPDLRESLARTASAAGLLARELRRDTPTLEQLFVRLVDAPRREAAAP